VKLLVGRVGRDATAYAFSFHNARELILHVAFYHLFSGTRALPSTQSGHVNTSLPSPCSVFHRSCGAGKTVVFFMKNLSSSRRMVTLEVIAEICCFFGIHLP